MEKIKNETCNCVSTVKGKLTGRKFKGRAIIDSDFPQLVVLRDGTLISVVSIPVRVTLQGLTGLKTIQIACAYCPFCGQKNPDLS